MRKYLGCKGTIRDIKTVLTGKNKEDELILVGGCDRHIRIFNSEPDAQKTANIAYAYLKQKINSMIISWEWDFDLMVLS